MSQKKGVQEMQAEIATFKKQFGPPATLGPPAKSLEVGSDLSVLIDKIVAWVQSLGLGNYSNEALVVFLNFAIEYIVPILKSSFNSPAVSAMIDFFVMLIRRWIDSLTPVPTPTP